MLNLGLYFVQVVWAYTIYIDFDHWQSVRKSPLVLFDLVHLNLYSIELIIVWIHVSLL